MEKSITISFSGKRFHEKLNSVPDTLSRLFAAFDAVFHNTRLHLVTGLADGADQIAADVFIKQEWRHKHSINHISMGAVLAFGRDDYLKTLNNKDNFSALYDKCTHKLQLDGIYAEGDTGQPKRGRAHRQQAKFLARIADVLIAVAPKGEQGGEGGTQHSIVCALQMGKPVILYNLEDGQFYFYNETISWHSPAEKAKNAEQVVKLFKSELYKPDENQEEIKTEERKIKPDKHKTKHAIEENEPIKLYHKEIKLIGEKKNIIFGLRKWVWESFLLLLIGEKKANPKSPEPDVETIKEIIKQKRAGLSALNNFYQFQYRGGYMLNYLLASLAVVIAVIATACFIYIPEANPLHLIVLLGLGGLKILLILLIIINTDTINGENYNKKAIEYRYASERLRVNYYLAFAGVFKSVKPSLGSHNKNYLLNYSGEILYEHLLLNIFNQQFKHEPGLPFTSTFLWDTVNTIKGDWYDEQVKYHERESKKMDKMHKRLEKLSETLGYWVLGFVGFEMVVVFLELMRFEVLEPFVHFLSHTSPALLGLTTLLPAIVLTMIGLNYQTEAKRLFVRSKRLIIEIKNARAELEATLVDLKKQDRFEQGSIFMDLLTQLDKMGTIMTDEVAEWSLLYEKTVPHTG